MVPESTVERRSMKSDSHRAPLLPALTPAHTRSRAVIATSRHIALWRLLTPTGLRLKLGEEVRITLPLLVRAYTTVTHGIGVAILGWAGKASLKLPMVSGSFVLHGLSLTRHLKQLAEFRSSPQAFLKISHEGRT